jgi:putative membrane protein
MKNVLLVGAALAFSASVWAQDKPSTTTPPAKPDTTSAKSASSTTAGADSAFVMKAVKGGMAEVELGKLAAEKASSDEVKKFGQRMADDHGKAGDELKSLAQSKNITVPSELDAKDKALRDRLSKLSGAAFDREYMKAMVSDHRKDVNEFRTESRSGKDADIKAWAAKTLPTLEEHLKHATETDRVVTTGSKAKTSANN